MFWSNGIESLHCKYLQVYGVPTERTFNHLKWTFRLKNKVNGQKIIGIQENLPIAREILNMFEVGRK